MNDRIDVSAFHQQSSNAICECLGIANAGIRHEKSLTSSVTDAWGVDWDEEMIARDFMQNFFDANRTCLDQVAVRSEIGNIQVSAPTEYNLIRLFVLGSEKDPAHGDVGQYGEGFKAAATSFLRKGNTSIVAASGVQALFIRFSDQAINNTEMYPLVYEYFALATPVSGNHLWLNGASKKLCIAMDSALNNFFHEDNPLIGKNISSDGKDFMVFQSTTPDGYIFYRNLKRGCIPDLPLVLVLNKSYKTIDNKTRNDRDRNAFGELLVRLFYATWAKSYFQNYDRYLPLLNATKHLWAVGKGHPLLAAVAQSIWKPCKAAEELFEDRYFAQSPVRDSEAMLKCHIESIEKDWLKQGKIPLPTYFQKLGATTAQQHIDHQRKKAEAEAKSKHHRSPTIEEWKAIKLLDSVLGNLAKPIRDQFQDRTIYTVAETVEVLGALKDSRAYKSREVFFSADIFTSEFHRALAVYLHEHTHIFGGDGSREFTDALTELIEATVKYRHTFDKFDEQWNVIRRRVSAERQMSAVSIKSNCERLLELSLEDLRSLLQKLPETLLEDMLPVSGS